MNKKHVIILAVVLVGLAIFGYFYFTMPITPPQPGVLDGFAQCLNEKGVVMYGAYWCVHCQRQKQMFGDSFKFINYVECGDDPKKCTDAGVDSFPTWIFADGKKVSGEQSIESLASDSGCAAP